MTLRVTGGTLRGRKLAAPRGESIRPTSSRVRESLFSILGNSLSGISALDLFAGAGTLGVEAASRGAQRVVFVEQDPEHLKLLSRNIEVLHGVADADILRMDARRAPARLKGRGDRFDLVFLDAPYSTGLTGETLAALGEVGDSVLQQGAVVVVESATSEVLAEEFGVLRRDDERRYGLTTLSFYRDGSTPEGDA